MMTEFVKIAVTLDTGALPILNFVTNGRGSLLPDGGAWVDQSRGLWAREPNETNIKSEISRAFINDNVVSWRIVKEIPESRDYRDAWCDDGAAITHDMDKARSLKLGDIRRERDEKLKALDTGAIIALSSDDKAKLAQIESEKQALRDLPTALMPQIESANTIDDLNKIE